LKEKKKTPQLKKENKTQAYLEKKGLLFCDERGNVLVLNNLILIEIILVHKYKVMNLEIFGASKTNLNACVAVEMTTMTVVVVVVA
jgi:hypothetical protein